MTIPYDEVPCRECGRHYRCIEWSHLMYKHDMDIQEYEAKYPNSPRICTEMLEGLNRQSEIWDTLAAYGEIQLG